MSHPDTCNCCVGMQVQTPLLINNRPGLNVIAYRVGTHSQFKQSLLARLSLSGNPQLARLTTREDDDFSIALLDAWSVVSDVFSFYQERIANESYLRTATERFSILEMARMIGYELNPGVAASAYIAFTLDDTPGALGPVLSAKDAGSLQEGLPPLVLSPGIKIQSIPGPGEDPQTFETLTAVEARPSWNAIRLRLTVPQVPLNEQVIVFKGTGLNLKEGDEFLIPVSGAETGSGFNHKDVKALKVSIDHEAKTTQVDLTASPVLPGFKSPSMLLTGIFSKFMSPNNYLHQSVVNDLRGLTWREADISALVVTNRWSVHELTQSVNTVAVVDTSNTDDSSVYVFRKRTAVFGYNAPKTITIPAAGGVLDPGAGSEQLLSGEQEGIIFLDAAYDDILPGSYITIKNTGITSSMAVQTFKVVTAETTVRTAYGLSTKTTKLSILPKIKWWGGGVQDLSALRSATVFAHTEKLDLAELPVKGNLESNTVTLDRYYAGLKVKQAVIITGERSDLNGVVSNEVAILDDVIVSDGFTVLTLKNALTFSYKPVTVRINANVAEATHGETVKEVLGSGNAVIPFQEFTLRQPPLTYVTAATPSGTQTTLEIRVNDVLWQEVDYFLDHAPNERIYITRRNNEGKTTVIFGDGTTGARLPTGQDNVRAVYRKGIGTGGTVRASQLSQLMTKPLGVKSAVNPVAASGAGDPELLEDARINAPITVLTLGRIVSLQDYEDFARGFAGIAKSLAAWAWKDQRRHVYITVAGTNGAVVEQNSPLYTRLLDAIIKAGNPLIPLTLESYRPAFFQVVANLKLDPAYLPEKVKDAVQQVLRDTFSFSKRRFSQPVSYSEVVACIQNTPGVIALDIDYLFRSDATVPSLENLLESSAPVQGNGIVSAAELLTLDPRPVDLKIIP